MGRLVALGAALMLMAAFAGPALAAPRTVKAVIHEDFGRRASARPCTPLIPDGVTCAGDGVVATVGRVTSLADYPPDAHVTRTLTFADGSTVTIVETYADARFPKSSWMTAFTVLGAASAGPANAAISIRAVPSATSRPMPGSSCAGTRPRPSTRAAMGRLWMGVVTESSWMRGAGAPAHHRATRACRGVGHRLA